MIKTTRMAAAVSTSPIDGAIVTFTNTREQKLRRWCLPNVKSPKAVCVMVHGVGDHIAAYETIAKRLFEKYNISLCGYDQVGHGKSEGPRVDIHDFQHYVDDLLQFVDIIKTENPNLPVFAMGHSMGGLVLGHAVLRKPDLCDGFIMYAAAIDTNPKVITPFKITMAKVLNYVFPTFPVGSINDDVLTRNQDEIKRLADDPLRHHGGMKARWGHNTLKGLLDFSTRMSEVTLPVFIAHGDADMVCHISGSMKFHDAVSSTDKTIKVYEGCYHRIHSEPDGAAEQFIDDVCDWMNDHCNKDPPSV